MPKTLTNALTPLSVKSAGPGRHADGGGLYLLVKPSGSRSWLYRFMLDGRTRDVGLGAAGPGAITLANARKAASVLRDKVQAGIDPLAERETAAARAKAAEQAARVALTSFRDAAESYLVMNEGGWRNAKHRQQWRNTLATYAFPVIGDMAVADVATPHVLAILEPLWTRAPETANRLRGRIETVLDAAKVRGLRQGENPARWRGHLDCLLPARSRLTRGHHKALPYAELPGFMEALRGREALAALALEFAILCAARTSEVLGARWDEFDLDAGVWTVPAVRMKAGREHRVPLSRRALAILEKVQPLAKEYVFPAAGGGKLSAMAMAMLLRRMGLDVTVHGFRSAFSDWVSERTGYDGETREMALAHAVANKAEAAYRRGDKFDKRARLMADWTAYCGGEPSCGEVVPIRRAA